MKRNFQSDTAEILGKSVNLITTKSSHYALPITLPKQALQKAVNSHDFNSQEIKKTVNAILFETSTSNPTKMAHKLHLLKLVNSAGDPWNKNEELKDAIKLIQPNCDIWSSSCNHV